MDKSLVYIALMGLVNLLTGVITIGIAKDKKEPPQAPCDTCGYLLKKGGGYHRYYCVRPGAPHPYDYFNEAPEYCSTWKPRDGGDAP